MDVLTAWAKEKSKDWTIYAIRGALLFARTDGLQLAVSVRGAEFTERITLIAEVLPA